MLFDQMTKIKDRVRYLLEQYPALRDDDTRLYATYISFEMGGKEELLKMSGYALLTEIAKGEITHFESVRRVRSKLQEQDETLRGEKYAERHRQADVTKNQIKDL
jgi:hypothetical protein